MRYARTYTCRFLSVTTSRVLYIEACKFHISLLEVCLSTKRNARFCSYMDLAYLLYILYLAPTSLPDSHNNYL